LVLEPHVTRCPSCHGLVRQGAACPGCGAVLHPTLGPEAHEHRVWWRWRSLLDVDVSTPPGSEFPEPSVTHEILEAAADPAAVRAHPITLRFASEELEAAFTEEYHHASLRHIRFAVGMGLFLVAVFGLLDAIIQPAIRDSLWLIRYGVICPVIALVFAVTFLPAVRPHVEWALASMLLVTGGGIVAMIVISPAPGRYFYYAGLILVIMYTFTFLKLRFANASVIGWAIVGLYIGAELVRGQTPWPILVNNLFFFVSATVIGMFAAYFFEALARRNFVQDKLVRRAREFGSYRLVERLGRGGMGEVWRAEHHLLARPAAIKLIRPEVLGASDPEGRQATLRRFEREAQATALLRSPHTIQLYDFGATDEGAFYYVMELLEGFDLETLVQRFGPVPWARAVYLLEQLCQSLAEAHEQGLIHRDIKPANIYVCCYGRATDFVKVLDFGLVKLRRESEPKDWLEPRSGELSGTQEGALAGTPSCMAPEQITGDRPLDARTDIYGIGCVAYWLLSGRQVFEAPTVWATILQHLQTPPTPPSARTEQSIPPDLDAAILTCLEKDPDRRPQTADALARLLTSCGDGAPWSQERAWAWWREHAPRQETAGWTGEPRVLMPSIVQQATLPSAHRSA
jgi:protein kinase-like protein